MLLRPFFMFSIVLLLIYLDCITAIQVMSPGSRTTIDRKSSFELKWLSVSTDPRSFILQYGKVGSSSESRVCIRDQTFQTSFGSTILSGSIFPIAGEYVFYLVDSLDTSTTLAQSEPFHVTSTVAQAAAMATTTAMATAGAQADPYRPDISGTSMGGSIKYDVKASSCAIQKNMYNGITAILLASVVGFLIGC